MLGLIGICACHSEDAALLIVVLGFGQLAGDLDGLTAVNRGDEELGLPVTIATVVWAGQEGNLATVGTKRGAPGETLGVRDTICARDFSLVVKFDDGDFRLNSAMEAMRALEGG